jgi:hypothetical protein
MTHYNIEGLVTATILGVIAAVCAITISKRYIFKPFRLWAKTFGYEWFAELCGCHWCLVFWVSAFLNAIFHPITLTTDGYPFVLGLGASTFWIFSIGTITLRLVFDNGREKVRYEY